MCKIIKISIIKLIEIDNKVLPFTSFPTSQTLDKSSKDKNFKIILSLCKSELE